MFEMLEYSPVPHFAVGPDNRIVFWNKSCELLTGYSAEKMLGTDRQWEPFYRRKRPVLADFIVKNDFQGFQELYRKQEIKRSEVVQDGWEAADFFPDVGGRSRYIHFLAVPVLGRDGKVVGALETLLEMPLKIARGRKKCKRTGKEGSGHCFPHARQSGFGGLIGKSQAMRKVYDDIVKAAAGRANVILYGESGTGKELVAQAIHSLSGRCGNKYYAVNSGAIPESLVESEFFGYKKGAFTGADYDKPGFLDLADGGTLFLDEVGEISQSMQVKLLRIIEGAGFSPVGSTQTRSPDIRFIAATKRNLLDMVKKGDMREDFFYRIHILPIRIPPLRARKEDIPLLIDFFLRKFSNGDKVETLPQRIIEKMTDYHWPGNVRELESTIQRYVTFNKVDFMEDFFPAAVFDEDVCDPVMENHDLRETVEEFEKMLIVKTLERYNWQRNTTASALNVSRKTLFRKMKNLGLL